MKETFVRGPVEQGVPIAECYPPTTHLAVDAMRGHAAAGERFLEF